MRVWEHPWSGPWEWSRDYVHRNGQLLAGVDGGNEEGDDQIVHFHLDHLGTPRQITNAAAQQLVRHAYYPFGEEASDSDQSSFTRKFTGHERGFQGPGAGNDLDYMMARFCSPRWGRFLSPDPVSGSVEVPLSWNRYAYVRDNPMVFVDPGGERTYGAIAAGKIDCYVRDAVGAVGSLTESGAAGVAANTCIFHP